MEDQMLHCYLAHTQDLKLKQNIEKIDSQYYFVIYLLLPVPFDPELNPNAHCNWEHIFSAPLQRK